MKPRTTFQKRCCIEFSLLVKITSNYAWEPSSCSTQPDTERKQFQRWNSSSWKFSCHPFSSRSNVGHHQLTDPQSAFYKQRRAVDGGVVHILRAHDPSMVAEVTCLPVGHKAEEGSGLTPGFSCRLTVVHAFFPVSCF